MDQEPRILVVDDDPDFRAYVVACLTSSGYSNVQQALDGVDAFRQLDDGVDLVISDNSMPGMDGVQLLARMRLTLAFSTIPFVLMSGALTDNVRADALRRKATACIDKDDIGNVEFLDAVQKALAA